MSTLITLTIIIYVIASIGYVNKLVLINALLVIVVIIKTINVSSKEKT